MPFTDPEKSISFETVNTVSVVRKKNYIRKKMEGSKVYVDCFYYGFWTRRDELSGYLPPPPPLQPTHARSCEGEGAFSRSLSHNVSVRNLLELERGDNEVTKRQRVIESFLSKLTTSASDPTSYLKSITSFTGSVINYVVSWPQDICGWNKPKPKPALH